MNHLSQLSQLIEEGITQLKFPESPKNLYDPLRYFMTLGGKRMRPLLTLLGTELFGQEAERALQTALAVEVFHNFTLIHDDIMDGAPLRRSKATVHTQWNPNIAILSGDVLMVFAYQLLVEKHPEKAIELLKIFNKTAIEVCEGQQLDMDFELRENVTIEEYIEMIRLKTSVLLGCALKLGAIIADADVNDRKHLYDFGQYVGIAFQIQDDILDLYANPKDFGKQVGGDVISNKKTLLNLKAFEMANEAQRGQLRKLMTEPDASKKVSAVRDLYDLIGVRVSCEHHMQLFYEKAMASIALVSVDETKKTALISLAAALMHRTT
jgi:geranylgeranyl diphosphate synthase type II